MKAHRTDGVSLTFGLLFLGMVIWWLLAQVFDLALPAVGWFVAGALILLGVLGLFGALRSNRNAPPPEPAQADLPASGPPFGTASGPPLGTASGPPADPVSNDPTEPITGPPVSGTGYDGRG